jgi:CPA1 family monovalent cation:H+ antiporter
VLVTLVVQGLTLRPLLLWLRVEDDGAVETEVRLAREETARAALSAIEACAQSPSAALVRDRYAHQLSRAEAERSSPPPQPGAAGLAAAQPLREDDACALEAIEAAMRAERQRLLDLRASGRIGDAAFQQVEQEIDWAELDLRQAFRLA